MELLEFCNIGDGVFCFLLVVLWLVVGYFLVGFVVEKLIRGDVCKEGFCFFDVDCEEGWWVRSLFLVRGVRGKVCFSFLKWCMGCEISF